MRRRDLLLGPPAAALGGLAAPALGQGRYPARPIRMIIAYPPGAATDAMSRLAAQKIGEKLGVTVVTENRSGGNGTVGSLAVLQAPADGYTILGSASIHVMGKHVLRAVPYDPVADFVPIARHARGPLVLVMDPRRPQRTVAEVAEAAKRDPNRWTFGTSSLGSAGHLGTIEFNRVTGANIEIVAYRGSAQGLTDVAAGNSQLMFDPVLATLPMIQGGQVRGMGIATSRRTPLAPDLPTMSEAGLPGFEFFSWYGVWGHRSMPAEIVATINAALNEAMREPETVARLTQLGFEPVTETPAELEAFVREDVERNAALLRLANFQPE